MKILNFKGLSVWQKNHCLVLEIYKITRKFPEEEKFGLVVQLRRASVSVCANIAEGYKKTTKDFVRFLGIAEGSLEETKYHLMLSRDLGYINNAQFQDLDKSCDEIGRMLNGLMRSLA